MNEEFEKLYDRWRSVTMFDSTGTRGADEYQALLNWSKEHRYEATQSIIEILCDQPNWIVSLLDELYPGVMQYNGFIGLEMSILTWLQLLSEEFNVDYKKVKHRYKMYNKFLKRKYIPWNPFKEEDPNPTFDEWLAMQ